MYGLMNLKLVLNCSEYLIEMNKFQLRKCLSISNDYHILFVWNILYNSLDLLHYTLIFGMETGSVYMGIGLSRPRHHCFKCLQPSFVSRNLLFIHFWKDDMFSELLYFDVFIVAKIEWYFKHGSMMVWFEYMIITLFLLSKARVNLVPLIVNSHFTTDTEIKEVCAHGPLLVRHTYWMVFIIDRHAPTAPSTTVKYFSGSMEPSEVVVFVFHFISRRP